MNIFIKATLALLFSSAGLLNAQSTAVYPTSDGLPLPWPFPWAKECPMDWDRLDGRFLLSDTVDSDRLIVAISVIMEQGLRIVQVARFSTRDGLIYQGFAFVADFDKAIHVTLVPTDKSQSLIRATIKLHYQNDEHLCTANHLVPILTLERIHEGTVEEIQYKMVKVDGHKN